ncbi:hypothetical protein [Streptomyces sp. CC208A]|uniref:hypothetical protein n=1 Tax=Streptomyces sp. CC208A TaxID=3044573 RepID=UPI0024A7A91D|nr:hypothetical protein [Streptomyces sp. CC208A]
MPISHAADGSTLFVTVHEQLAATDRAAAALEIEAAAHTHHPRRVTVRTPAGEPTPAMLSAVVRAHRMCDHLGIPLALTGATASAQRLFTNLRFVGPWQPTSSPPRPTPTWTRSSPAPPRPTAPVSCVVTVGCGTPKPPGEKDHVQGAGERRIRHHPPSDARPATEPTLGFAGRSGIGSRP